MTTMNTPNDMQCRSTNHTIQCLASNETTRWLGKQNTTKLPVPPTTFTITLLIGGSKVW